MARASAVHDHTRDSALETMGQVRPATRSVGGAGLQAVGNQELQRLFAQGAIQAKLAISQPNDPDEREADRVTEQIMRMEEPVSIYSAPGIIQRTCAAREASGALYPNCAEEEKVQRKGSTKTASQPSSSLHSQIVRPRGGGEPLSPSTRTFFEPRFGRDLSHVRVHTGKEAADSAQAIRARAYTVKNDIVFGESQYSPNSIGGKKLLAHELTHVVQQRQGVIARAVARNYSIIESDLSYGVIDWAITEAECDEVIGILTSLSPTDLEDTVRRMQREDLVIRLMENVSQTVRTANATLLRRIQEIAQVGETGGSGYTAGPAVTEPMPEAATHAPETFDPCLVDVYALTNAGLLSYYQRALTGVNRGRDAPGYFNNRNLQRRLITERDRRIALGHAWLATMPETIPQTLRRIVDSPSGSFQVLDVPGMTVAGVLEDHSRAPLMTSAQFGHFLETHNIERVDVSTYRIRTAPVLSLAAGVGTRATVGSGLYNTLFDAMVIDPYGRPLVSSKGNPIMKWLGRLGEAGFSSQATGGLGMLYEDTNARSWVDRNGVSRSPAQEAYPAFDFDHPRSPFAAQVLGVQRVSVKVSTRAVQADRFSYFRRGMQAMYETSANSGLPRYIANEPQYSGQPITGAQYETNRSAVLRQAVQAINEDDVAAFRQLLSNPAQRETPQSSTTLWEDRGTPGRRAQGSQPSQPPRAGWRQIFEGAMRENPVTIERPGGTSLTFSAPDVLDQALRNNQITAQEHAVAQQEAGRRASSRIVGIGRSTAELSALRMSRQRYASLTDAQLEPIVTPEFMRSERLGSGVAGEIRAGTRAGFQGAGAGGIIAVVTTAGIMLFDVADHPNWVQELGISGGLGAVGGGTGAFAEQIIVSNGTRIMLNAAVANNTSLLTPTQVRGLGLTGGGAVGAMFIEGISMALDERENSALEGATRIVRSGGLGAGSVWAGTAIGSAAAFGTGNLLASAGIGAAAGSFVPVAGTAVGFIVGLVAGGFLYYVGDRVVPGGREDWDAYEAGCHFRPATTGGHHYCFTGNTPVRMADGAHRRIDQLREGDNVLSYDERDASLQKGKVLKIERSIAPTHFKLHVAKSGVTVGITGEHPIHTKGLWLPAKMLRAGSIVTWLDDEVDELGETEIVNVTTDFRPAYVYDLTVSDYHTFFAGGILAHNKNI